MSNTPSNNPPGILGFLGIAFVILKILGEIDWSWWWVLTPFFVELIGFILGDYIRSKIKTLKKRNDKEIKALIKEIAKTRELLKRKSSNDN